MVVDGDDAGHCTNGLTAKAFREATEEERAVYRSWLRSIIFFYCALLFVSGVALATYSGKGRSQVTDLAVQKAMATALAK